MESPLASTVITAKPSLWIVVQLMASSMFSSGKDLVATGKFTSMDTLSLLCFADSMGGRGVGKGKRDSRLCSVLHDVGWFVDRFSSGARS